MTDRDEELVAADREDLRVIRGLVSDTVHTLTVQSARGIYPYDMTNGKRLALIPSDRVSMSTNSMVCYAIACLEGMLPDAVAAVSPEQPGVDPDLARRLRDCLARGLAVMIRRINDADEDSLYSARNGPGSLGPFDSATFGLQDPFTLTWLVELLRLACREQAPADAKGATMALDRTEKAANMRVMETLANPSAAVLKPVKELEWPVAHPLPLLRVVQLYRLLGGGDEQQLAQASRWFSELLHRQLSLRTIEHGAFDPAELVFALEGMLETAPRRVTSPILNSVSSCVEATRRVDPALRAITPFKTAGAGAVHLFVGVEVFASLLRIVRARERAGDLAFFDQVKPVLHGYLQWLQATVVTGSAQMPPESAHDSYPPDIPLDFLGWESEYAHRGEFNIHIWLTSQVILFLQGYETLLTGSVARAELKRAGLSADQVTETADAPAQSAALRMERARKDDPLQVADASPYRVVSRLTESFVLPRMGGDFGDACFSCLLYGPSGTGKTALARRLAADLDWPLLSVTTGDFIMSGEARAEARAKEIFGALSSQRNAVVFFDDVDRLLLDRESHDLTSQGDALHFMTTSMLAKINGLRRLRQTVIVIATSHVERIDHEIRRPGWIDEHLLVLPPDVRRRREIIVSILAEHGDARADDETLTAAAAKDSTWLTTTEVDVATRRALRIGSDLGQALRYVVPAISLNGYIARLGALSAADADRLPTTELLEEAFLLTHLLMEGKDGEHLPQRYQPLGNWWSAMGASVVRDADIRVTLDKIFA